MILSIPAQYGYTLLSTVILAFEIIIIGFVIPMSARKRVFTDEFLKQNFGKEHMQAFGEQIKNDGYPDMGNGRYSQKLNYQQWYDFNSAQRAHYNFLQWIASTIVLVLIAGIYFPIPAAALGLAIFIGRLMYVIGYMTKGPRGRTFGVLVNDFAFLGAFVLAFISSIYFILGL